MNGPLLLLGAQRSGTTAFAHALSRAYADSGGLFTVNGKLPYLLPRWCTRSDLAGRHFRADEIWHALGRKPVAGQGVAHWRVRVGTALRAAASRVAEGRRDDPSALVREILTESYAAWPFWGDKYNEYLLDLPTVLEAVPSARLLLLVRHPYEVAASTHEWAGERPWKPATDVGACAKWAAWHRGWLALAPALDPARQMVVGYRALCDGRATRRLSTFVGLDLAPYLGGLRARRSTCPEPDLPADLDAHVTAVWGRLRERENSCE
ncbi:sulfotransferase [Nonomuraea sp. NPDC003727]